MKDLEQQKFLLLDKSAWDPFAWSISNDYLSIEDIKTLWTESRITPLITWEAVVAGEFTKHSYSYNLFSGASYSSNESDYFGLSKKDFLCLSATDGTLTPSELSLNGALIGIWRTGNNLSEDTTYQAFLPDFQGVEYLVVSYTPNSPNNSSKTQTILWEESKYWKKLDEVDKSLIYAQRILVFDTTRGVASLVNAEDLRNQHNIEGFEVYGSASMLAGMCLKGKISFQKATSLYYSWREIDKRWTPQISFRQVLEIEKERFRKETSFWL